MFPSHPFAALLDPSGVLSACAESGALAALPVSAARSADRVSPKVAGELAKHDAALEEMDKQLVAKSSKASSPRPSRQAPRTQGAGAR